MFMPINTSTRISFALVILIIMIIGGIINAFGLFTEKRQNLLNLIFGDIVVDVHYIDEGESREINHGRAY